MRYLSALLLVCVAMFAHASDTPVANAIILSQVNAAVTDSVSYYVDDLPSNASGIFGWDGTAKRQQIWTYATVRSAIGAYPTPTGTTSQYVRGDGSLATLPSPAARSFAAVTPTLNSAARLSTTNDIQVFYPVDISATSLLLNTTTGTVTLQYADDSGFTTNVVAVGSGVQSVGGVASLTNVGTAGLSGIIPANKYRRILTANTAGTPTFTARPGQEVSL